MSGPGTLRRRSLPATLGGICLLAAGAAPVEAAAPARAVPSHQALVVLLGDHVARSAPTGTARKLAVVADRRPLTGVHTVLPVLARRSADDGREWLRVMLPGRPNGRRGWIPKTRTLPSSTSLHLAVDLSARRVTVRDSGTVVRRFRAVVGARSTPTPRGRFFIEEALALGPSAHGGPFALATSARSRVLRQFEGGPGQIALHGVNHLHDPLGTAASHGCIRLSTRAITWLSRRVGAGVPLVISA